MEIALTLRVILPITLTFNCRGVLSFVHINEMMLIQKQHFFEIRLLVKTYSFIYRSSIDMILKVTSKFKIP